MTRPSNYKVLIASIFAFSLVASTDLFAQDSFAGHQIQLNGNAQLADAGATLRLTTNGDGQVGSAFITEPFFLGGRTSFNTFVQFRIHGGSGADGMAFVIQNDGGAARIGGTGGSMGYGGIDNSLAIELDTFLNGWDPNANHIGVNLNGSLTSQSTFTPGPDLDGGSSLYLWVDYNGGTNQLDVFFDTTSTKPGSPVISEEVLLNQEIGAQAYVGFTAATGALNNNHDIEAWTLNWRAAEKIPTLSEWSRILMILLIAGAGFLAYSRAKSAKNT